ncbi:MAG: hypothetical protein Q7T19_06375 [Caulobacter sp.]|nr:hypothetical protein [Caulobacter sp.]
MVDLTALALRVRSDVETYVVPERHPDQKGAELPAEWFEAGLAGMRAALVEPHWVDVPGTTGKRALVVADDGHTVVVYDPAEDADFLLLQRINGQMFNCHVRGDAVGCFLAS